MSKYHVAGWTFTAACFGVTTVAVVCGGGAPANADGYDDTAKWDDFGKHYRVSNDNKHGYDYNKHGDTKVAHSDWNDSKDWNDSEDWNKDSDDNWKHDSDHGSTHDDRHATYASYHEDQDSSHDSEWWAAQNAWDHWAPNDWKDAGASFDDYYSQFMEYAQAFHWDGGDDNWSPNYGSGWQDNWYNWDPTDWAKAGASYHAWHSQLHAYFEHCNSDWDSGKHHEYMQTVDYHEDDKDDWKDDSSENHDGSDNENHDWKDDASYKHDDPEHKDYEHSADYASKYDDGCDDEEEHKQHAQSDEWGGEVHDDSGHEISYVIRQ